MVQVSNRMRPGALASDPHLGGLMKLRSLLTGAVLAAVSFGALPARADTLYQMTFQGVVGNGSTDVAGFFGIPGADLSGDPFTSTYLYDPTLAGTAMESPDWVYGGSYYGNFTQPILAASITINNQTYNVPISSNAYYAEVYLNSDLHNGPAIVADICGGSASCGAPELANYVYFGGVAPSTLTSVGTYNWDGTNGGYYLYAGSDFFFLTAESIQIAETPLPSAVALFATGLGMLGLLGWRRKRNAQAVT